MRYNTNDIDEADELCKEVIDLEVKLCKLAKQTEGHNYIRDRIKNTLTSHHSSTPLLKDDPGSWIERCFVSYTKQVFRNWKDYIDKERIES